MDRRLIGMFVHFVFYPFPAVALYDFYSLDLAMPSYEPYLWWTGNRPFSNDEINELHSLTCPMRGVAYGGYVGEARPSPNRKSPVVDERGELSEGNIKNRYSVLLPLIYQPFAGYFVWSLVANDDMRHE